MEDKLLKEIKNNVGYVWINRPDKKNALDADVWFGLPQVINELDSDDEVRCIVIAGKGARLLSEWGRNSLEGSNPSLSAMRP